MQRGVRTWLSHESRVPALTAWTGRSADPGCLTLYMPGAIAPAACKVVTEGADSLCLPSAPRKCDRGVLMCWEAYLASDQGPEPFFRYFQQAVPLWRSLLVNV